MANTTVYGSDLEALNKIRGELPVLIAADEEGNELFEYTDHTQVIQTNAGLVNDDEDGFAELAETLTELPESLTNN